MILASRNHSYQIFYTKKIDHYKFYGLAISNKTLGGWKRETPILMMKSYYLPGYCQMVPAICGSNLYGNPA